jgi:hypothetical protein
MKKYYIGFAVLFIFVLGALVYTLEQGASYKNDKKTSDKFTQIANKLDQYTINNPVPDSLDQAGTKDIPDTITYTKVDSSKFKLCVTYDHEGNLFDAGWTSLLGGYSSSATYNTPSSASSSDQTYIDTSVAYNHKKGENCQTVKPYSASPLDINTNTGSGSFTGDAEVNPKTLNASNDSACSSAYDSYYTLQGSLALGKVDTSSSTINFSTSGQVWKDSSGATKNIPPIASKKYDTVSVFCNSSGKSVSADSLKTGVKAKVYISDESSGYVDKIQL